jgi:hypothetical protein
MLEILAMEFGEGTRLLSWLPGIDMARAWDGF